MPKFALAESFVSWTPAGSGIGGFGLALSVRSDGTTSTCHAFVIEPVEPVGCWIAVVIPHRDLVSGELPGVALA